MKKEIKKGIIMGVLLATVLFSAIKITENLTRTTTLSGITVNTVFTEAEQTQLKNTIWEQLGEGHTPGDIHIAQVQLEPFLTVQDLNGINYQALQGILSLNHSQELDFAVMDQTALDILMQQDIFMDIRKFLNHEEQARWNENYIFVLAEEGADAKPVALDVTQLPLFQNMAEHGSVYFAVMDKTVRKESCQVFWQVICNWEAVE